MLVIQLDTVVTSCEDGVVGQFTLGGLDDTVPGANQSVV